MKMFLSRIAPCGLLAGVLAGLAVGGASGYATAQSFGDASPSYFRPAAASPIGASVQDGRHPFLQVGCESTCAAPCVTCEPACASSCGGCGVCDDCCAAAACCDNGCCNDRVFYIGLSGGWAHRETAHEVSDAATFLDFNDGFHINFQLGRSYEWVRIEAEVSHFDNDVLVAGAGVPNVGNFVGLADGSVSMTAFMFNAYHDFDIEGWRLDPYVGGGIGLCQSEINGLLPSFFAGAPLNLDNQAINATSDYSFAWQLRVGANYDWSDRTTLYMGYRYFRVEELSFAAFPFGAFQPNGGREHCLEWGLRVAF